MGGITKSSKSWMTILIWKAMVLGYPHFRTSPSGAAETQKTVDLGLVTCRSSAASSPAFQVDLNLIIHLYTFYTVRIHRIFTY